MKTCVRKVLDYWIPPRSGRSYDCAMCEANLWWGDTIDHAPECPTQADPIAVARFFGFLVWLQSILTPAPVQEYLGRPWQSPPPQRRGGL